MLQIFKSFLSTSKIKRKNPLRFKHSKTTISIHGYLFCDVENVE